MRKKSPFLVSPAWYTLGKKKGFQLTLTIDISMGYYYDRLDLKPQCKCVSTTPWGRSEHSRMSIVLSVSADTIKYLVSWLVEDVENFCCLRRLPIDCFE